MILRDRDTSGGGDGTLDERVYYLQNWRADVVALITGAGAQVEQVRYEPYGSPFGIPAGDVDASSAVDGTDVTAVTAWYNAPSYDVRGDLDMDGDLDTTDLALLEDAKDAAASLGLYQLSMVDNRKGYAGYELLGELSEAKWDVRNRVLNSSLGRWNRRDQLGYVDGHSLYRYAQSPISLTDPAGTSISQPGAPAPAVIIPTRNLCRILGTDAVARVCANQGSVRPLPPGVDCDIYPLTYTYACCNAWCFCMCAGTSPWSNYVRRCLNCMYQSGCSSHTSHVRCYEAATAAGLVPPLLQLATCTSICWVCPNPANYLPPVGPIMWY